MASLIVKTGARRMFPAPFLLLAAIYPFVNLWNTAHAQFPVHFSCPQLPPLTKPAQNVYELRPQDIKVVMAMGDSITAGDLRRCAPSSFNVRSVPCKENIMYYVLYIAMGACMCAAIIKISVLLRTYVRTYVREHYRP